MAKTKRSPSTKKDEKEADKTKVDEEPKAAKKKDKAKKKKAGKEPETEPQKRKTPAKKDSKQKVSPKKVKGKKDEEPKLKKKKKKDAPRPPPPEPEEKKPSKIDEYELRFGSLEVILAAGDLEASNPNEKFLVGRLQEDVLFGCDSEAYVSVEWFDFFTDNVFDGQGLENIDHLPAGSLVCSITKDCKEGFSRGKDTLTIDSEAWKYADRKLKEQLDDSYQSDEDSQFGDEAVNKRLRYIRKKTIDSGIKGRKPITVKSEFDFDDDDVSNDGGTTKSQRKRKAGKKKSASSPKSPKKAKRGLTPRPELRIVEDGFDQKTGKLDDFDGDVERSNKEVLRAVQADDVKALRAAVDSDVIFSMHYPRSVGLPITPLMLAMVDGNVEATQILLEDASGKSQFDKRAPLQKCALPKLSTGKISGRHANYNRRKINASRGGREGNNALLYDAIGDNYIKPQIRNDGTLSMANNSLPILLHKYKDEMIDLNLARDFDEIPKEVLDVAEATFSRTLRDHMTIENLMRGGQRNAAKRYIDQQLNSSYTANNFNFLHSESLGDTPTNKKKPFSKDFQARSVAKLSSTDTRFSPLACACINPKSAYLEALLTLAPEHAQLNDSKDTSLLHYAAACESPEPLQYLLKSYSLSKTSIDKRKEAPIHYAARAARPENIRILLEDVDTDQKKSILSAKTTEGLAAIHYAVITQRCDGLEAMRVLLEAGSDPNFASTAQRNKLSPVHLAARVGNLEALKLLVKLGGNLVKGDKLGRSPLIHACMNGHAHVVSYLLVQGVSVDAADSSDNFPAHYAAAYGWNDCLQLLLDAGANADVKNSWKTSPLAVAVQKGRHRVSSLLLKIPSVDVNFKDDDGKTLFFRLSEGFIAEKMLAEKSEFAVSKNKGKGGANDNKEIDALKKEMPWALQKLLDRKDVNLATEDSDRNTVLHLLCYQNYATSGSGEKRAVAFAKLILSWSNVDVDVTDSDGMTPLLCAAKEDNASLLKFMINRGASMGPSSVDSDGKNLCHFLLMSNECRSHLALVEKKAGRNGFCAMLKAQDGLGLTPLHQAMLSMVNAGKGEKTDSLQTLVKSLVDKFPELATIPVGHIGLLKDPDRLAELLLFSDEEEEADLTAMRWQGNHRPASTPTILSEKDRADAAKIRKALKSRDQAVPSTSTHHGKCLIHFICDCRDPNRTRELLEWIVPLSKKVINTKAGTDNDVYTPLQQLLYKILPANDLKNPEKWGDSKMDRLKCLSLVLDSIELILKNGAKNVNTVRRGAFGSLEDLKLHKDGAEAELTEKKDAENMKALRRCADSVINKKDTSTNSDIVGLFENAMAARKTRVLANSLESQDLPQPIPHHLAQCSSPVPINIWARLIKKCGLDLMQCDVHERSVLHVALTKENAELSQFLCMEFPALVTKTSTTGERPIHVVAKLDKAPLVKLILEHLKDKAKEVNRGDLSGRTAFHFSVEKAAERTGEVLDPCEILFLRAGARLDISDGINKRTPLHYCFLENASLLDHYNFPHSLQRATHDRVELASSLLVAEGAGESVKMADKFGRTPLCYAAAYNSTVSSLLLVSKGANLFQEDQDGNTPINVAVLRGHGNYAITMLKSAGSDNLPRLVDVVSVKRVEKTTDSGEKVIEVVDKDVHSIVWHAIKQNLRGLVYILLDTSFPLQQAAIDALSNGSFQLVRKLLTTSSLGVIRHVDGDSGRNLLHEVARVDRYDNSEWSTTLAELLLSSGISASATSKDGQTALHIAASRGHVGLARLLVDTDEGALLLSDSEGHTPLARFMRALPKLALSEAQSIEMVTLLTRGVDSLCSDRYNRVPRTKSEEKTIEYNGIEFRLGPNRETVLLEIEANRDAVERSDEEDIGKVEGYSTLLIQALHARQYDLMQVLLDKNAPIDSLDSSGLAVLHHAVLSNSLQAATLLLCNKANLDLETGDDWAATPLIIASFQCGTSSSGSLEMANLLIRSGANVTKTCKASGATALHIACRENNYDFASLTLRGALHAGAKKKKKATAKKTKSNGKSVPALVRLGQDCALYPAKIQGDTANLFVTGKESSVPLSWISETFESDSLCLQSLKALVKLKLGKDKRPAKTAVNMEQATPEKRNPREDLSCSDGDKESYTDEETEEEEEGNDTEQREAQQMLSKYYGLEVAIVGADDPQLTKPFEEDSPVIVQNRKPKQYANEKDIWMEGRVIAAHKNGTYDVDVYRGLPLKGVVRQQLRPWKTSSELNWPSKASKSNKSLKTLLETEDEQGFTPLMAAIKPVDFGAYEQRNMINVLLDFGATIGPAALALARPTSDFLKFLLQVSGRDISSMEAADGDSDMHDTSALYGLEPISNEEFQQETKKTLLKFEARGLLRRKHEPPPINPVCELKAIGLRVLPTDAKKGEDPSHYYNVIMTKCELTHYGHSENKYYKMQLVEDPNKKLFVLVNNWGQIGDYGGQKQETPFGSKDEAVAEFSKVFKAKTGNLWRDYVSSGFQPKLGKYKPARILSRGYEKPKVSSLVDMIDDADDHPDIVRESSLPSDLSETLKAFVDPEAITNAANNLGLQQEKLPLGRLSIQVLLDAESKLNEVEKALQVVDQKTKPEELTEKREAMDQVAILSSQFYELLPTKEGDSALSPLKKHELKEQRSHILQLKDLTVASQIVNSAVIKGTEENPLDFAYRCLGASMKVLSNETAERIGVEQYFRNTSENDDLVVSQVYQLKRQDEASNKDMQNHRLLWHGTNRANVMGVIKEGLRVAPPTAQMSGNAFGDGVYFADMVAKSWHYCREHFDINAKEMPKAYLFLADVALGEQECVSDKDWFQKEMDDTADSVWAVGYEGPDANKDIALSTSGAVMPLGSVARSPSFQLKAQWSHGWREMADKANEAIEAARTSPDTEYPKRIETEIHNYRAEVVLEHGPFSETARVVPVKVRKVKERSPGGKKKRKDNTGQAIKKEDDGEEEQEVEYEPSFSEFSITRKELGLGSHVHYNEFVVNDTQRINLRFLVEVTSKAWLKNKFRKSSKK